MRHTERPGFEWHAFGTYRGSRGQSGKRGREGGSHRLEWERLGCGCWVGEEDSSCLKMAMQERSTDRSSVEAFLKLIISLPLLAISQGSVMTKKTGADA